MKQQDWINAYEDWNVDQGLASGFKGKAQIGKGMWAMPDEMAQMMTAKIVHPMAGRVALVPSPTAATLHAVHYHQVSVAEQQSLILGKQRASTRRCSKSHFWLVRTYRRMKSTRNSKITLRASLATWCDGLIKESAAQKCPDIHDVGLMEDRQPFAFHRNTSLTGCTTAFAAKQRFAECSRRWPVVDAQNAGDKLYEPMAGNFEQSIAFQAACDLVFKELSNPMAIQSLSCMHDGARPKR